jgi:hypothetical protein
MVRCGHGAGSILFPFFPAFLFSDILGIPISRLIYYAFSHKSFGRPFYVVRFPACAFGLLIILFDHPSHS